jgi:L-fuconolactonase
MRIDSHQHFWTYNTTEYGWISEEMRVLRHDYVPEQLQKELVEVGMDGAVSVQARQSLAETEWLLRLGEKYDFIKGVVGWLPLCEADVAAYLERYGEQTLLKGVRHVLQDESDDQYVLREDFNRGIRALRPYHLVYDILIFERHLPQTVTFVDRHPDQIFVLDHIAKPAIKQNLLTPWRENIRELAKREHVFCKISGLVTEADWSHWGTEQLRQYIDIVLGCFGPDRLLFGSDWPVCLLASTYSQWFSAVTECIATLSKHEKDQILGDNAAKVYGLAG